MKTTHYNCSCTIKICHISCITALNFPAYGVARGKTHCLPERSHNHGISKYERSASGAVESCDHIAFFVLSGSTRENRFINHQNRRCRIPLQGRSLICEHRRWQAKTCIFKAAVMRAKGLQRQRMIDKGGTLLKSIIICTSLPGPRRFLSGRQLPPWTNLHV